MVAPDGREHLVLDPDGTIRMVLEPSMADDVRMRCRFVRDAALRCYCDAETPPSDYLVHVAGETIVIGNGAEPGRRGNFGMVTPAPTTAVERLRVLFVVASALIGRDFHGDEYGAAPPRPQGQTRLTSRLSNSAM